MRSYVLVRRATWYPLFAVAALLTLAAATCEPANPYVFAVHFDSHLVFEDDADWPSDDEWTDNPFGTMRHRIDHTWELFLGHFVTDVQVHFSRIALSSATNSICLSAANGSQEQCFTGNLAPQWSNVISTTLLRWRLNVNAPTAEASAGFIIDSVRVWSGGLERWLDRHPQVERISTGRHPNVHELQQPAEVMDPRNREAFGLSWPGTSNFYIVQGAEPGWAFDFDLVGAANGPPVRYTSQLVRYQRKTRYVTAGRPSSGASLDDIVVITEAGEVHVIANRAGSGFRAPHLAHRAYPLVSGSSTTVPAVMRFDGDADADLLAVGQREVLYALSDGDPAYAQFGAFASAPLTWPTPFRTTSLPGTTIAMMAEDVTGDGLADVIARVDVPTEPNTAAPTQYQYDHVQVFVNTGSLGFANPQVWLAGNGLMNRGNRFYEVGDVNGDGSADMIMATAAGSRPIHVALANPGASRFMTPALWQRLPAGEVTLFRVGRIDGDGRTDLLVREGEATTAELMMGNQPPLWVYFAQNTGSAFNPPVDFASGSFILGNVYPGRFRPGGDALLNASTDPLSRVLIHPNGLAEPGGPVPRFLNQIAYTTAVSQFRWADVNADRKTDLVEFTGDAHGSVEVFLSDGEKLTRCAAPALTQFANDLGEGREEPFLGDVDDDGYADLILLTGIRPTFLDDGNFVPQGAFVAVNRHNCDFATPARWNTDAGFAVGAGWRPFVGDFDGDGRVDIGLGKLQTRLHHRVSLNRGSQFGNSATVLGNGTDWLGSSASWGGASLTGHTYELVGRDVNTDGRADLVVLWKYQGSSSGGSTQTWFAVSPYVAVTGGFAGSPSSYEVSAIAGTPAQNQFTIGRFSSDHLIDVATFNSPAAAAQVGGNYVSTWLNIGTGAMPNYRPLGQGMHSTPWTISTRADAVDLDGNQREEMALVQRGVANAGVQIVSFPIADSDLDLYVERVVTSIDNALTGDFDLAAAARYSSNGHLWDVYSPSNNYVVRVDNRGSDPGVYTLISNQRARARHMQVQFISDSRPANDWISTVVNIVDEMAIRYYDALDGFANISTLDMYYGDGPGWFTCDQKFYVHDNDDDNAHAYGGCWAKVYEDDNAQTWLHEAGHAYFGLYDEYCKPDPGVFENMADCPGDPPENISLCAHSLMSSSQLVKEFCTRLPGAHASLDVTPTQVEPAWDWIFLYLVAAFIGDELPVTPETTPNPFRYDSWTFRNRLVIR